METKVQPVKDPPGFNDLYLKLLAKQANFQVWKSNGFKDKPLYPTLKIRR
jgi:hypothetical protein